MVRIDARGLEPPEPFMRVVQALASIGPGEEVLLILEREPFPLYNVLSQNGYEWHTRAADDGRFEILIRPTAAATPSSLPKSCHP